MKKMWKKNFRDMLGILIIFASIILGIWLSIAVMLVGGIQQAIVGFQTANTAMATWGIIRALFFELGFLPTWIGFFLGIMISD